MSNARNPSHPTTAEENLFLDILNDAPLAAHRKPTRIYGSIFYCVLLAGYAIVGITAPWIFERFEAWILPLLCSCNVILLLITGVFQQYMVYQVRKIRLQGYYMFSQKLKHIVRLPFATLSLRGMWLLFRSVWDTIVWFMPMSLPEKFAVSGIAGMLLLVVWEPRISFLSSSALLRIVMLVEVVIAGSFMAAYIGYLHQYNSLDSQPDVLDSLYSPLQPSSSLEGLRYHEGGRLSDQQMALLQYQRENIHFLCEEILRLQECLSKYERSDDGNTQVDLAHLLAARDQELRTLSAEMDQLQSELRLARSVISDRDAEIQRVRTTNNQYVEENERLRAILGEWSARTAKLERALEMERMSNLELQKKVAAARTRYAEQTQQQ